MSQRNLPLLLQSPVLIIAKEATLRTSAITNIPSEQAKVFENDLRPGLWISDLVILNLQESTKTTLKNADKILGTADGLHELRKSLPIQHYPQAYMIQVGTLTMPPLTIWHTTFMTLSHRINSYLTSLLKMILPLPMDLLSFLIVLEKFDLVLKYLVAQNVFFYPKCDIAKS